MSVKSKWNADRIPDQASRVAIVTGANTGIGYVAALELARQHASVILACRSKSKGQAAVERIKAEIPTANCEVMELDLSSQQAVRVFADEFSKKYERLDLLINNAGVMMPPYSKTADGLELQFGTNHLGHYSLTGLLLGLLLKTGQSRIVTVASMAHRGGKLDFDDLNWERRKYKKMSAYGDSKIANLYFTRELQRKLTAAGSSTIAVAAHPGWTATDLQRHIGLFKFLNSFFAMEPQMGALPTLYAAVEADVKGGDYIGPDGWKEIKGYPVKVGSNALSQDMSIAEKLWTVSEKLTGVKYTELLSD